MAQEDLELTDPRNPKNKIVITVSDGNYPTKDQVYAMFDKLYPAQPKPKPEVPPAPKVPPVAPKPTPAVPLPSFMRQQEPAPLFGPGAKPSPFRITVATAMQKPAIPQAKPVKPTSVERALSKPPTFTPTAVKLTPQESNQIDVNFFINRYLTGDAPESIPFQKFTQYVNAKSDAERNRITKGLSETAKQAFALQYQAMQDDANKSRMFALSLLLPEDRPDMPFDPLAFSPFSAMLGLKPAAGLRSAVEAGLEVAGGRPRDLDAAERLLQIPRMSATAMRTGQSPTEALPLGFDPAGAMLPKQTSPGVIARQFMAGAAQPENIAMMVSSLGLGGALRGVPPLVAGAIEYGVGTAFSIPILKEAIETRDPKNILTAAGLALGPMALFPAARGAKRLISGRRAAVPRGGTAAIALARIDDSVARSRSLREGPEVGAQPDAVQVESTGTGVLRPEEPPVGLQGVGQGDQAPPVQTPGEGGVQATAAPDQTGQVTPPVEPPVPPQGTAEPTAATGDAGQVPGNLSIYGQTQLLGSVDDQFADLWGGGQFRLTAQEKARNYAAWRENAARALVNADDIFASEIEPFIADWDPSTPLPPELKGRTSGDVRVVAAYKQAELLAKLLDDPTNPNAEAWRRDAFKLGKIVIEAGSNAGLELAMTRWFNLGDIDWTAPDARTKVAAAVQRLGIDDPDTLVNVDKAVQRVVERVNDIHAGQDAKAAAAEARATRTSQRRASTPKGQASQAAARASRTVRDFGPDEAAYNAALDRVRASLGRTFNTGFDPTTVGDLAIIGTYKLKNGLADFILWSNSMVADFGESVRPYLQKIWDDIEYKSQYGFNTPKVNVMTMFSGGGVFEQGIHKFANLVAAIEFDTKIANFHRSVWGDHVINDDVRNVNYKQFRDKVDHLHASPVCKAFSTTPGSPAECELDMEMASATARAIREIFPTSVSIENVEGYINSKSFQIILDELGKLGYKVDVQVYNAADFGTPQSRKRMIARAWRLDQGFPEVIRTHGPGRPSPWVAWDESTEDLIPTLGPSKVPNWMMRRFGIEDQSQLPVQGVGLMEGKTFAKDKAPRIIPTGRPANTILARPETFRVLSRADGEVSVQGVTPRGIARMMGLPDSYPLPTASNGRTLIGLSKKVIGNGVTPQMSAGVVGPMLDVLAKNKASQGAKSLLQIGLSGPSPEDYAAATKRLLASVGRASSGFDPTTIPDLVIVGWYVLKQTGRKFSEWSQAMRAALGDIPIDDARLQEVWINARYREQQGKNKKVAEPTTFVSEISKVLGLENTTRFLESIREQDGTPAILTKLIVGEKLTSEEQARVNAAWDASRPERPAGATPAEPTAETPMAVFKKGIAELKAAQQEAERQRKQSERGSLDAVKKSVDKRLGELSRTLREGAERKAQPLSPEAARYKSGAQDLTSHIRATVQRYGANLNPDEVSALVDAAVNRYSESPGQIETIKGEFTRDIQGLNPTRNRRTDLEQALRSRLGKDRADHIIREVPDDVLQKLAEGLPLTPEETRIVGDAYATAPKPVVRPKAETTASEAAARIVEAGAEARKEAARLERESAGDFANALRKRFGNARASLIAGMIDDTSIESTINSGETLSPDQQLRLAEAIRKTERARADQTVPNKAMVEIMNAQERARGQADLERVQAGSVLPGEKINVRDYLDLGVKEYRTGAGSLVKFRQSIEQKYPGLFTEDELNKLFNESAKAYEADMASLNSEKEKITKAVIVKMRENMSAGERLKNGFRNYSNIFRAISLGQDFGILMAQGAIASLTRPGTVLSGLPSATRARGIAGAAQSALGVLTGSRMNRKSPGVLSAMFKAWGSERKVGEFEGEMNALQDALYGSKDFYKDSGLILEDTSGGAATLPQAGTRAEMFRGLEALEATPGIGPLYEAAGKPIMQRFERATAVGLNRMRVAYFESLMEPYRSLPEAQRNDAAKIIAELTNMLTGRASLTPEGRARVAALAEMLNAPEFYVGKAQVAGFGTGPIYGIAKTVGMIGKQSKEGGSLQGKGTLMTRANLASTLGKEYARGFVSFVALKTAMEAAGFEVDTDPLSPDFMSARVPTLFGGYRKIDLSGGVAPYMSLIWQTVFSASKLIDKEREGLPNQYQYKSPGETLYNFAKGKLTAGPQMGITLAVPSSWIDSAPKRPEKGEIAKAYLESERRTVGGKTFQIFKDGNFNTASLVTIGEQAVPLSILARNFLSGLTDYSSMDLTPEEKNRAIMDWIVGNVSPAFGFPISSPRLNPELRRGFEKYRSKPARTGEDIRKRELELLYKKD